VLAVWVGNFDGEGDPAFVGRKAAGPLFFRIVDAIAAISPALPKLPGPKGLNLRRVKVCAASGGIPGPFCPSTVMTWFIPGVSPIEPDTVYRQVRIDVRTGQRACSPDAPGTRAEVFEFWPSDLLEIFREADIPRRVPPPYPPHCAYASATGAPPEITSPRVGIVYTMRAGETSRKTIPLRAVTDGDVRQIYWFLDTRYLGHSRAGTPFFWRAEPGRFTLRAVDDQGRSQSREVRVARVD